MKIDEIIRNPYYLVAGILLALISLILVGFALVIGGCVEYPDEYFQQEFVGYPFQTGWNNTELERIEEEVIEFVAQDGCVGCFDTEKGTIEVYDYMIPDILPLCITQDDLNNWWVVVKVTGGYEPIDGSLTLKQKGEQYCVDVEWSHVRHEPCYADYWMATFVLPADVSSIELDSNQWPDCADPLYPEYDTIPGKEVCVSYDTLWQGCVEVEQRFELIQTQKNRPLDDPNFP